MSDPKNEAPMGHRFQFGRNWQSFVSIIDDDRIACAQGSLRKMLESENFENKTFLDIGSGSGLFSLAARKLGAVVHSFDYDEESVQCTLDLKSRFLKNDQKWKIERGSVLDYTYVSLLGKYDIVYAWGVLHHTGNLWKAIANVERLVADKGLLYLSIYNYQRRWTQVHTKMKHMYVNSPWIGRFIILYSYIIFALIKGILIDLLFLKNPLQRYSRRNIERGMSWWHDVIDWVGGYPFETAKPEEIFEFFKKNNFSLEKLITSGGGHGCNEYVFRRLPIGA